jgi:hypothetical protein
MMEIKGGKSRDQFVNQKLQKWMSNRVNFEDTAKEKSVMVTTYYYYYYYYYYCNPALRTKQHAMTTGDPVTVQIYTLTWALDGDEWLAPLPGRFTPDQRLPGTCCIKVWVGLRTSQNAVGKHKVL